MPVPNFHGALFFEVAGLHSLLPLYIFSKQITLLTSPKSTANDIGTQTWLANLEVRTFCQPCIDKSLAPGISHSFQKSSL